MSRHVSLAWLLVLLTALTGCDSSEERYDKAVKKYETIVNAGTPLTDASYDALLKELDGIHDGKAAPKAERLAGAIRTLREPRKLPPRPLAVANAEGNDAVERKSRECAELAKQVGLATDAGRSAAIARLAECRTEVERLDVARVHAQDPLGADAHEGPAQDGGGSESH
jgi:ABC-type Fe2+-enterobactin transport system substrate-binding protein